MKQFRGIFLAILSSSTFGMIPFFALPVIREGVGIDSILFIVLPYRRFWWDFIYYL
ncbi:MAG: hypothetical protein ACLTTW_07830 [Coprobacter sp.]